MLRDDKWIDYAIKILLAVDTGANTISRVAEIVGGSETYIAKLIAVLRKNNLIDAKYNLNKSINSIMVYDLFVVANNLSSDSAIAQRITSIMLDAVKSIPIKQVAV